LWDNLPVFFIEMSTFSRSVVVSFASAGSVTDLDEDAVTFGVTLVLLTVGRMKNLTQAISKRDSIDILATE